MQHERFGVKRNLSETSFRSGGLGIIAWNDKGRLCCFSRITQLSHTPLCKARHHELVMPRYIRTVDHGDYRLGTGWWMTVSPSMVAILLWHPVSKDVFHPTLWRLESGHIAMVGRITCWGDPMRFADGANVRMDLFYTHMGRPVEKRGSDNRFTVLFCCSFWAFLLWECAQLDGLIPLLFRGRDPLAF